MTCNAHNRTANATTHTQPPALYLEHRLGTPQLRVHVCCKCRLPRRVQVPARLGQLAQRALQHLGVQAHLERTGMDEWASRWVGG